MEDFMIEYADAFYKSLENVVEGVRIILPLAITIVMLVGAIFFIAGAIACIYEEIKRRKK